jgi:monoamine oxidase
MDGAVQAGERAAREVLHQMGTISEQEIHQDEPTPPYVIVTPCQLTLLQQCLPTVPGFVMGIVVIAAVGGFISYKHFTK